MKNIIIGVSSLLMTLAGAEALAQVRVAKPNAPRVAPRAPRTAPTVSRPTTTTTTARPTADNGVLPRVQQRQQLPARTAQPRTSAERPATTTAGQGQASATTGAGLLETASEATRGAVSSDSSNATAGSICAAGGGFALSCDKFGPEDQQLLARAFRDISTSEQGSVNALGRELAEELTQRFGETVSTADGVERAKGLIEGDCVKNI